DSDSPKVYLALGASLAVGTGATNEAAGGYVPLLFTFFSQPQHGNVDVLTNLAKGGETSGSMISTGQLAAALTAINNPATNVRVATLDIGGNDVLRLLRTGSPCVASPPDPAA